MLILNVAAGKFSPILSIADKLDLNFILNVDTSYFSDISASGVEDKIKTWGSNKNIVGEACNLNINIFEFLERTTIKFDRVIIYRFLEHVSFTQVEYFIYLISTVMNKKAMVDVIVPNYKILSQMLLDEDIKRNFSEFDFQSHNILLTTELLNEPSCPHASVWTPERMKRFWELENRFKVVNTTSPFNFDGRDIYLRSIIERV